MTKLQIAELIEDFLSDSPALQPWAWDDFISVKQKSTDIEKIRMELLEIERLYPSQEGMWCSLEGQLLMREVAERIRRESVES